ncbi:MAG: hypothetical protein IJY52_00435, partial [Anaerotignum sp.]|nr:hypothetical protein [Anaerotignum sp.]
MGNRDVSIVFRASNRLSGDIRQMQGDVRALSDDVRRYQSIQKQTFEEKAKVKLDITEAKAHMKELEKAVKSGAEGAKEAFLEQQTALEGLNEEYKRLTSLQNEATRAEKELSAAFSKSNNAAGRGGTGMLGALAQAGLGNMLGGAVGNLMGGMATSAFGSTIGGTMENIGG